MAVDKNGNISQQGDRRALYTVMMDIRVQVLKYSGTYLYKAALIALRYSAVRRQFKNTNGSEMKLLDYQTQ